MLLPFLEARARAVEAVRAAARAVRGAHEVPLAECWGRVLDEAVPADRDQPPFHRSTRDGFAVRAGDVPGELRVIGEIAAGTALGRALAAGETAEIMTGAPLPDGADAVVMVEHSERAGDRVKLLRAVAAGENVVPAGSELAAGAVAVPAGARLGPGDLAMLASVGRARVQVRARPRVAVLATGDELVEVAATPGPTQIRNSNGPMLAAQVARAGGTPIVLPPAPDRLDALRALLARAFDEADLVVLSGGVSMGKHDLVEAALLERGARVVFDGVAIRPGKPVVFGLCDGATPFFGLPGNPLSSYVTFELFARPVVELLGGAEPAAWHALPAPLAEPYRGPSLPLTIFAPARLGGDGLRLVRSQGSGDLASLSAAHGFAVLDPATPELPAGASVPFMPR